MEMRARNLEERTTNSTLGVSRDKWKTVQRNRFREVTAEFFFFFKSVFSSLLFIWLPRIDLVQFLYFINEKAEAQVVSVAC